MKADQIQISHFDFLTIRSLEIDQEVGKHACARIYGYIRDEDMEEYQYQVLEPIWVTVTAQEDTGEKRVLMKGMVAGFSFMRKNHVCEMTLILKSGTYQMEGANHFRSFQDTGMSYWDVLEKVNQPYGNTGIIGEECMKAAPLDFLLQYQETDWNFVKRIASRFGLSVTPAADQEGVFYYVGGKNYTTYELPAMTPHQVRKRVDAFMRQASNGMGSKSEQDYLEYEISSREIYDLWDLILLGYEGGHVAKIHSEYKGEELIHTSDLRSWNAMGTTPEFNLSYSGCSFCGVVEGVKGDLVQIRLYEDENAEQGTRRWFPFSTGYSSPDGAGWYCMPEIGDEVRLQIPDKQEEHAYIISAVHKETAKDRKNPDRKSFKTKYGKELAFSPGSLEMTNNQGMYVRIQDGIGIEMVSNKEIKICSGENVSISSESGSLILAGTQSVDIHQGGTGLHMDENIVFTGGKFRVQ